MPLPKTSKNVPYQKKIRLIMPVTEKKLIITCFLVKFCIIQN